MPEFCWHWTPTRIFYLRKYVYRGIADQQNLSGRVKYIHGKRLKLKIIWKVVKTWVAKKSLNFTIIT